MSGKQETTTNQYDYENRLVLSEKRDTTNNALKMRVRYFYNGDGQLMGVLTLYVDPLVIEGSTSGIDTYYLYDGSQVIADLDGAGGVKANYTRAPAGKMLSMYNILSSGSYIYRDTYYAFTDSLGSNVMFSGKDSGFSKAYSYEEFGKYTSAQGGTDTRFTFTGAPYFSGPGLYQMGARYYNPSIGRFITRDTYKGDIYQPWTQNLYTYCNNNPVNYVDPTGHMSVREAYDSAKSGFGQVFDGNTWRNSWNQAVTYLPVGTEIFANEVKEIADATIVADPNSPFQMTMQQPVALHKRNVKISTFKLA